MVKQIIPAISLIFLLTSCSALKSLNITSNKQVASAVAPTTPKNNEVKFIDDINVAPQNPVSSTEVKPVAKELYTSKSENTDVAKQDQEDKSINELISNRNKRNSVEVASPVQLKYAVLLNTEVESLPDKALLETVDDWYGVRYRTGGNTKKGVDCSGFTVAVYAALYGITLPRVSREQYRTSRHISTTELREGDLLFFDTRGRGSISHVAIYLGNNKFIHASVSKGVMVSGLLEPYYLQRYVGAGRIDDKQIVTMNSGTNLGTH